MIDQKQEKIDLVRIIGKSINTLMKHRKLEVLQLMGSCLEDVATDDECYQAVKFFERACEKMNEHGL